MCIRDSWYWHEWGIYKRSFWGICTGRFRCENAVPWSWTCLLYTSISVKMEKAVWELLLSRCSRPMIFKWVGTTASCSWLRDVYKRQVWFSAMSVNPIIAFIGDRISCDMLSKKDDFALFAVSAFSAASVSYTHLDVYKRQGFALRVGSWCEASFGI